MPEYEDLKPQKDPKKTFTDSKGHKISFVAKGDFEAVIITCLTCGKTIKLNKKEVEEINV